MNSKSEKDSGYSSTPNKLVVEGTTTHNNTITEHKHNEIVDTNGIDSRESSDLLSINSIERRLALLDLESTHSQLEERDTIIHTLFPTELVIERPTIKQLSRKEVWQKWRNVIRNRRRIDNRKFIFRMERESREKEKQSLVYDYSTDTLSYNELELLSKGESFCPSTHFIDEDRVKVNIYQYARRLRLHEQHREQKQEIDTSIHTATERRSNTLGQHRLTNQASRRSTARRSSITASNTPNTFKQRRLPSTYDPITQNRNLIRYNNCIQEDCMLFINSKERVKDNITKQQGLAIKSLMKKIENKQIIITKADKGSGIVVLDYSLYIHKGTQYIEEEANAYNKTNETELDIVARIVKQRNRIIDQLKQSGIISTQTATFCSKQTTEKITGMKFFFKIHKDQNIITTPLRPLQSCIGSPTHHLSLVLTDILQPLLNVTNIPSFIFDSNQLLFRLKTLGEIPVDCTLISSDVAALYPSIPHEKGLEAMRHFLASKTQYSQKQISALINALKLVISDNYVMWNNSIYKQKSGVAMGTPVAVAYANIFMAWVDKELRAKAHFIHEHIRYIDDNLFVLPEDRIEELMGIANNILPEHIKYTYDKLDKHSNIGLAFLDTQLFISDTFQIESRLYTKKTDRHAYLLPSSYHPPHIVKNIPKATFKRLRRICSKDNWFVDDAKKAKGWLIRRGYNTKEVQKALESVAKLDRWEMIIDIERKRTHTGREAGDMYCIPLVVTYDKNAKNFKNLLQQRQELLNSSFRRTKVKPRLGFRRQKNLDQLLIQTALRGPIRALSAPTEKKFMPCEERPNYRIKCPCRGVHDQNKCRCCVHAVYNLVGIETKISRQINCSSKNLVYLIGCKTCDKRYVGETQQMLKDRLLQHLTNIYKLNQPLYLHFRNSHPLSQLFISVLETVRGSEPILRKVREAWWINHLQTLGPIGFNIKLDCNQIYDERPLTHS